MWQCKIKIPEKVSLNKIYAGIHFKERQRHKDAYFYVVKEAKPLPYDGALPVRAHYHFKTKGSKLDISNHAYMLKMTEDALVAAGVIPGDDPKFVGKITITGEQIKTGWDEVTVTLQPMM